MTDPRQLTRRERQILDLLYQLGPATVGEVQAALDDGASYSTVRTLLRLMEEKGHLQHSKRGRAFVYSPVIASGQAAQTALQGLVRTFFAGSAAQAISALLQLPGEELEESDIERIEAMVARARRSQEES